MTRIRWRHAHSLACLSLRISATLITDHSSLSFTHSSLRTQLLPNQINQCMKRDRCEGAVRSQGRAHIKCILVRPSASPIVRSKSGCWNSLLREITHISICPFYRRQQESLLSASPTVSYIQIHTQEQTTRLPFLLPACCLCWEWGGGNLGWNRRLAT